MVGAATPSVPRASRGLLPVSVDTLVPRDDLDFDLFIRTDESSPVLYRGRDHPLTSEDLDKVVESGVQVLYIRCGDHQRFVSFLREILANDKLPSSQHFSILKEAHRQVFEESLRLTSPDRIIDNASEIGSQLTDLVCRQDLVMQDLFALMEHDYYTYTHATNVGTLSVLLANELGGYSQDELCELATGALLHDLGKRHIPAHILNKKSKFSEKEWEIMCQHPVMGFRELCRRDDMSWGQLMIVYQHHERIDGSGYPVGISRDQIHPWAQVCTIADVFDALTSDRSYKSAWSIVKVNQQFKELAGKTYDKELVECWIGLSEKM